MEGTRGRTMKWKSFKEKLKLNTIGCFGANPTRSCNVVDNNIQHSSPQPELRHVGGISYDPTRFYTDPGRMGRNVWDVLKDDDPSVIPTPPIKEDEVDGSTSQDGAELCCVCMSRKKGAAIVPCGHVFCRYCSNECFRINLGCPLCNGYICDILNLY